MITSGLSLLPDIRQVAGSRSKKLLAKVHPSSTAGRLRLTGVCHILKGSPLMRVAPRTNMDRLQLGRCIDTLSSNALLLQKSLG